MDFPKATRYGLGFGVEIRCLNILIKTYISSITYLNECD